MQTEADIDRSWRMWGRRGTAGASIPVELAFEEATRVYGSVTGLAGVSLTVQAGEIVCLLGQSGCGKSTLLRIGAGVEPLTSGRVLLDGREVAGPDRFVEPERRGVGLMFQDYALFPHLSVMDNVTYGVRGLPASDTRAAGIRALERVGLAALKDSFPHMLSGGEQQRVALARAIAPRPGVLLMDEPFSNLDRRLKDAVREETIAVIRETGATSILVTHDPEDAMRIADRIVLMRKGKIAQIGTGEDLYRRPASLFAARFFSDFNEIGGLFATMRSIRLLAASPRPVSPMGRRRWSAFAAGGPSARRGFLPPGRVAARRFLGEVDVVHVAVQGLERPLTVRTQEHTPFKAGTEVGVDVRRDEVLVFSGTEP